MATRYSPCPLPLAPRGLVPWERMATRYSPCPLPLAPRGLVPWERMATRYSPCPQSLAPAGSSRGSAWPPATPPAPCLSPPAGSSRGSAWPPAIPPAPNLSPPHGLVPWEHMATRYSPCPLSLAPPRARPVGAHGHPFKSVLLNIFLASSSTFPMLGNSMPPPRYTKHNLRPAYLLRYSWTAFPHADARFPDNAPMGLLPSLASLWETDGLRLLEQRWDPHRIQVTFSTIPQVAPEILAARAKGRLQHALRQAGHPVSFARNFSVRALGNNTRLTVEHYLDTQVQRASFANTRYQDGFDKASWASSEADLSKPFETNRGRYWYVLHLVLVTSGRFRIDARVTAQTISQGCRKNGSKKRIPTLKSGNHARSPAPRTPRRAPAEPGGDCPELSE